LIIADFLVARKGFARAFEARGGALSFCHKDIPRRAGFEAGLVERCEIHGTRAAAVQRLSLQLLEDSGGDARGKAAQIGAQALSLRGTSRIE
jgi:hypothetical protein